MQKLLTVLFGQEENGKLTEKTFIRRIAVGIISIVFCMSAMGISAYAFFTNNVTSGKNTLIAATYEVNAVVKVKESTEPAKTPAQGTTNVYALHADTTYEVQLAASGNAQNGYCRIELLDGTDVVETYYTKPLPPNSGSLSNITFHITCYEAATIRIASNWGSYAGYAGNLPQEGETDKLLYKGGVWSNAFAIGAPSVSNVSDDDITDAEEKQPEQEQSQNVEEEQKSEEQQTEEPIEEPVIEQAVTEQSEDKEPTESEE